MPTGPENLMIPFTARSEAQRQHSVAALRQKAHDRRCDVLEVQVKAYHQETCDAKSEAERVRAELMADRDAAQEGKRAAEAEVAELKQTIKRERSTAAVTLRTETQALENLLRAKEVSPNTLAVAFCQADSFGR